MSNLLFPTFDLKENEVRLITQVYETIRARHPEAAFDFDYKPPISKFEAFRGQYTKFDSGPVLCLDNGPCAKYLCFAKVTWEGLQTRYSTTDHWNYQTWGIALLKQKYGHVLIRPETTLDKIRELIHHVEIDFDDDKVFSDQFYVLANVEDDARKLLGPAIRQSIVELQLKDFVIEVIDNVMIVCDNKNLDATTAVVMASFLDKSFPYAGTME